MTKQEVVVQLRDFTAAQFPKSCGACGRRYGSLSEYLLYTTHLGEPVQHDAELENWESFNPTGGFSLALCNCGASIAISTKGMSIKMMNQMLQWGRIESRRRGITIGALLTHLRAEIDKTVIGNAYAAVR